MKKGLGIIIVLVMLLPALTGMMQTYACGTGSYQWGTDCDSNCNLIGITTTTRSCFSDGNQCLLRMKWTGCYWILGEDKETYKCELSSNWLNEPCDDYVQPTPGGGGCAPPPAPYDLLVDLGTALDDKVSATWGPGTPGTPRPQVFAVTDIYMLPSGVALSCRNNGDHCIWASELDSSANEVLIDKSLFTLGKIYHFYIFNMAGSCTTYDYTDVLFSYQPSPTPVLFRCEDFTTVRINNCDGASFSADPKGANCYTPNSNVILNMEESWAQTMSFVNTAPGTDCGSIPAVSFLGVGRSTSYARSRMWTLEPGQGEKQVCAMVGYDENDEDARPGAFKRCEARIMVGTAPTPTLFSPANEA